MGRTLGHEGATELLVPSIPAPWELGSLPSPSSPKHCCSFPSLGGWGVPLCQGHGGQTGNLWGKQMLELLGTSQRQAGFMIAFLSMLRKCSHFSGRVAGPMPWP